MLLNFVEMFGENRVRNSRLILPHISNKCIFIMSKITVHPNVGYLNTEFTICVITDPYNKKLIMVGSDGVVIIRNLYLD
jgi:hypothetical protein